MPRVSWAVDDAEKRQENRRKIILMKMMERDINKQTELASMARINEMTLSRVLHSQNVTTETLVKIDKVLHFTDSELASIVRGK